MVFRPVSVAADTASTAIGLIKHDLAARCCARVELPDFVENETSRKCNVSNKNYRLHSLPPFFEI